MSDLQIDSATLAKLGLGQDQRTKKEELGQTDFLELMVAQMSNQNPLEPQENGEFLTQMAQFGTVDGIKELQNSFGELATSLHSNQALQASALVGRTVLVPSNTNTLTEGGTVKGQAEVPNGATNLTVSVYTGSGELVKQMNLGDHGTGEVDFNWDGTNNEGSVMPAGQYKFVAEGLVAGNATSFTINMAANVDSVSLGQNGSGMKLNIAGIGEVSFDTVKHIK